MQELNEQLYDICTEWHVPFWQKSSFLFFCGLCGIALLALACWYIIRNMRRKQRQEPYHIVARRALDELQKAECMLPDSSAQFYAALIIILKKYLTEHYHAMFISKTDCQMLPLIKQVSESKQVAGLVEHILQSSVTVRFAGAQAARQNMQEAVDAAIEIVVITQAQKSAQKGA